MKTDWESLSKTQERLAYITVIMEAAEKFEKNEERVEQAENINNSLKVLFEYCVVHAQTKDIKLCVPFPTEEDNS